MSFRIESRAQATADPGPDGASNALVVALKQPIQGIGVAALGSLHELPGLGEIGVH
jgi:hypothetical protein